MFSLVKNELYKIFHKKGIYILLAIVVALTGFVCFLNANSSIITMLDSLYATSEVSLDSIDINDYSQVDYYLENNSSVQVTNYLNELKLDYYDPEYAYGRDKLQSLYRNYYSARDIDKDTKSAETILLEINKAKEFIKNFDWKVVIQEEIDDVKENLELCETDACKKVENEKLYVLQYRLDNNIPISFNEASLRLDEYIDSYTFMEEMYGGITSNKDEYDRAKEIVTVIKYQMENRLLRNNYSMMNSQDSMISRFGNVDLFVVITILLISGSIVAQEFNKGTIKQLLVRPYSRTKIIVSKMIASFIAVVLTILILAISETLIVGLINNTLDTLLDPVINYNYATGTVVATNILVQCLFNFACILPKIFIINLFIFGTSCIFTNTSISTILGLVLFYTEAIFTMFANRYKVLTYLPSLNWDLNVYQFGGSSGIKYMTFSKAITIDIITIVVLFVATIIIFKKKDIKNQ